VAGSGLPADAIQLVDSSTRETVKELMTARGIVDVLIPRGGADLIQSVVTGSTLLVHASVADEFLPRALAALAAAGVTVHGSPAVAAFSPGVVPATADDWGREYLSLDLSADVVPSLSAAVAHIRRYGTGHSETIVTRSQSAARSFVAAVDAAAVLVNASSRFVDGGEFGFGAEIGISTQKLHARGPMGLAELTSTKYVVTGDGHTRP